MTKLSLKDLSDKQRQAWQMRYRYGWRLTRIALKMGITQSAVTQLILRAERRVGLHRKERVRIIKRQPRLIKAQSLSNIYNY